MKKNISLAGSSLKKLSEYVIPIILLSLLFLSASLAANGLTYIIGQEQKTVSPLFLAIILGIVLRNTLKLPESIIRSIGKASKILLKFGIILMGIKINILLITRMGFMPLLLVVVCISSAIGFVLLFQRFFPISRNLALLIAGGTSICGVSAIAAITPVIGADEEESGYAIGTITIFGMLATFVYPYITELVFSFSPSQAGLFLGTSIHDTSQVTAAALIYDQLWSNNAENGLFGSDIAITVKLVRNTCMLIVIPVLGFISRKMDPVDSGNEKGAFFSRKTVPVFVFGFILMAVIRTVCDGAGQDYNDTLGSFYNIIRKISYYSIGLAISGIGLGVNIRKLKNLGVKPLFVGLFTALIVGGVSFLLLTIFKEFFIF